MLKSPFLRTLGLVLLLAFIVSSCKHSALQQAKFIPKDANFVFAIKPKNFYEKIQEGKLNLDSIVSSFSKDQKGLDASGIKTWNDLKTSGVDWTKDIFFFMQQKGSLLTGTNPVVGFVGALKSSGDFESFLKKQSFDIQKAKDYSFAKLKDNFVAGWNSDVVIVTTSYNYQRWKDTATNTDNASQKALEELFAQKEENSVASIEGFKKLSAKNADALFWVNAGGAAAAIPYLGITKASDLIKDAYSAGTINFEKGVVNTSIESYYNKDLINLIKKNPASGLNSAIIENYPGNVNGYAAISFNPKLLSDVIRFIGLDGTVNQYFQAQQFSLSLDDIVGAFKGDIAVVFSNLRTEERPNPYYPDIKSKKTLYDYLINIPIGDKKLYDKLMSELAAKGVLEQKDGQYIPKGAGTDTAVAFSTDDKGIIVSSSKSIIQQYKSGNAKVNLPADVKKNISGKVVSLFADLQSIFLQLPASGSDSFYFARARQTFKDFSGYNDKLSGNFISSSYQLHTMNDQENSLVTLIKFISDVSAYEKKQEAAYNSTNTSPMATDSVAVIADSVVVAPPVEKK